MPYSIQTALQKKTSLSVHYQVTSTNTIQHRQYLLQAIDMCIFYDLTKKSTGGTPSEIQHIREHRLSASDSFSEWFLALHKFACVCVRMCMSSYNHRRLTVLTTHIGRYLTKLLDNVGAVGSLCSMQRGSQSSHGHRWLAIFARGQHKELLELPLQRLKSWPLHLVLGPALQHDLVEGARAAGWTRHPIAVLHLVQNLRVGHPCQHIETVHQLSEPTVERL